MTMIIQQLRAELRAAHTIIRNALAFMTFDQKLQWANANERDDAVGEGVTRANERQAVIDNGSPLALFLELRRAELIIANAWEIQSFHQHALWTTANLQDGVAACHPTRADVRRVVLNAAAVAPRALVGDARGPIADGIVGYIESLATPADSEQPALAAALQPHAQIDARAEFKAAFTEWCERFPEISSLARLGAAWNAARAFGSLPAAETNGERR
ncbi:hypothetical protein WJ64_22020 [Burkholderia ubonensis]|nr:hypothetical protein WJ64_22020 [Burkholderia ubonensis]